MEEAVKKIIDGIDSWDELRTFETNARELGRFDDEVAAAVAVRISQLGRTLVARHTNLELSNLNAAEARIVDAVAAYAGLKKAKGSHSEYTFRQLRNRGLLGAAEAAVCRSSPTEGFQTLVEENLGKISYEQIVIEHPEFFSSRAAWYARRALGLENGTPRPPAAEPSAADPTEPQERNAAWSRDELILALDLYIRHRAKPLQKNAAEIVELSSVLNRLGEALDQRSTTTYRNENGVYMKLMNFKSIDPAYIKEGKKGLNRNNKDEAIVWEMYAGEPTKLSLVAQLIRAGLRAHEEDHVLAGMGEPEIVPAEEGRMVTRLHTYRERDRRIVTDAKKAFLKKHSRLFCQCCGFDFSKRYGAAGEGIIDVHHTKPVHTLKPGELTQVHDLALLCANCHRVVHSKRKWLTIDEVSSAHASGF
jgi:predicted HNH restriction endonuclease